jgi:Abortive infection C-terminus
MSSNKAPVNDAIIVAVARLVDDAQSTTREPSHSDLEFQICRSGLSGGDPKGQGQAVGKAKRVRAVLSWGIDNAPDKAETFVAALIGLIRGKGGFRAGSSNFVGEDEILDARDAFRLEGYVLSDDGELYASTLDNLSGVEMTAALEAYMRRAQRGSEDGALLVGTGKDLLEATAAHIITEKYGQYSPQSNFPTLLGQAFTALGLATPQTPVQPAEAPQRRVERSLYEAGCAVNALRNKTGTGHGRPFMPSVSDDEARAAVQLIGIVSGLLLRALKRIP